MNQVFSRALRFWRTYGTRELVWRLRGELATRMGRHAPTPTSGIALAAPPPPTAARVRKSVQDVLSDRFTALTPLPSFQLPPTEQRRVNIVTDSINVGSMFGGVGTALIIGTLLANRLGANLRIITRTEPAQAENLDHLLSVYGLALEHESEFVFLPRHAVKQAIDFSESDIFITTSWWTTAATLGSVAPHLIWYLLQEDERMFYPYGDDRVACESVLRRNDIRYLINTQLLYEHLSSHGMGHLKVKGMWFEPAFPASVYYPRNRDNAGKRRFAFYARPNNLRNLFYLGLKTIEAAIAQGVLDPSEWDILLVGKDIPDLEFSGGVVAQRLQNLSWADYSELVGTIDVGLSLMSTPHPSYPPLDLAASGAVVVTNIFGNKQDLSGYCANLICAPADTESLIQALAKAVTLAKNRDLRKRNFDASGLCRDWNQALGHVLAQMDVKA